MFRNIYNRIRNLLNREEGQGMVECASSMERYAHKGDVAEEIRKLKIHTT